MTDNLQINTMRFEKFATIDSGQNNEINPFLKLKYVHQNSSNIFGVQYKDMKIPG